MLEQLAKSAAARLPHRWQQALKRIHFARQLAGGTFRTNEQEWEACRDWLQPGDWAIDVGANIGHYTARFSELVGAAGRVVAFEPVPATFELLAANTTRFRHDNVTLLNAAASDSTQCLGISIPTFTTGLVNYYGAALTTAQGGLQVLTLAIDALELPGRVRVIKIDAEGHDDVVVRGARRLIERDRPVLVIESVTDELTAMLGALGYTFKRAAGSTNIVGTCPPPAAG